jgi:hypothetical protein
MNRTISLILAAIIAAALFGGLVYAVLVAAHVSEAAASTVYGVTPRRLWATTAAGLALVGVVLGGLALRRSAGRHGLRAIAAVAAGLIALVNGGLNLAMATGPGMPSIYRRQLRDVLLSGETTVCRLTHGAQTDGQRGNRRR